MTSGYDGVPVPPALSNRCLRARRRSGRRPAPMWVRGEDQARRLSGCNGAPSDGARRTTAAPRNIAMSCELDSLIPAIEAR